MTDKLKKGAGKRPAKTKAMMIAPNGAELPVEKLPGKLPAELHPLHSDLVSEIDGNGIERAEDTLSKMAEGPEKDALAAHVAKAKGYAADPIVETVPGNLYSDVAKLALASGSVEADTTPKTLTVTFDGTELKKAIDDTIAAIDRVQDHLSNATATISSADLKAAAAAVKKPTIPEHIEAMFARILARKDGGK